MKTQTSCLSYLFMFWFLVVAIVVLLSNKAQPRSASALIRNFSAAKFDMNWKRRRRQQLTDAAFVNCSNSSSDVASAPLSQQSGRKREGERERKSRRQNAPRLQREEAGQAGKDDEEDKRAAFVFKRWHDLSEAAKNFAKKTTTTATTAIRAAATTTRTTTTTSVKNNIADSHLN